MDDTEQVRQLVLSVPGVTNAITFNKGQYVVYFDPNYDRNVTKKEIGKILSTNNVFERIKGRNI